jgi:hypothetical protein
MERRTKLGLATAGVMVALLVGGWLWGASGRFAVERQVQTLQLRLELSQARTRVLEARVSLHQMNFGQAGQQLEQARPMLRWARERFQEQGQTDAANTLNGAVAHIEEAQRLAGMLDQAAEGRAAEAGRAIDIAYDLVR